MTQTEQVHVTDEMIIEWDVPIEMDDGTMTNPAGGITASSSRRPRPMVATRNRW